MLKIDMVPSFQINRLCSPCYLAFVTPKRIDAIEQNAGSTLQVPHISKPLRGKHFIQGHHQGVKKTVDEGLRPVSHGSLEFFGKVIGIESAAPVYKYRSLAWIISNIPLKLWNTYQLAKTYVFCPASHSASKSQRTKTQETLHVCRCLLPVVLLSVPFIAFLCQKTPVS